MSFIGKSLKAAAIAELAALAFDYYQQNKARKPQGLKGKAAAFAANMMGRKPTQNTAAKLKPHAEQLLAGIMSALKNRQRG